MCFSGVSSHFGCFQFKSAFLDTSPKGLAAAKRFHRIMQLTMEYFPVNGGVRFEYSTFCYAATVPVSSYYNRKARYFRQYSSHEGICQPTWFHRRLYVLWSLFPLSKMFEFDMIVWGRGVVEGGQASVPVEYNESHKTDVFLWFLIYETVSGQARILKIYLIWLDTHRYSVRTNEWKLFFRITVHDAAMLLWNMS